MDEEENPGSFIKTQDERNIWTRNISLQWAPKLVVQTSSLKTNTRDTICNVPNVNKTTTDKIHNDRTSV